jgi:hypothetical protein
MGLPTYVLPPPSGDDTTTLLRLARLQEMIPSSDVTFSDTDLLALMNQELISTVVPLVIKSREEYMVVSKDYNLPAVRAGQVTNVENWIDLPEEATGLRLRDVYMLDSIGQFVNLPRLNPEQVASYSSMPLVSGGTNNVAWTGGYGGFYLMGSRLMIFPYWSASNRAIRLTFARRPARMCATTDAAQIVAISGTNVTVGATTAQWGAGSYVDFIRNATPHDYVSDLSATQALYTSAVPLQAQLVLTQSGSTYTFSATTVASLKVGDWIASNGYAPFAQFIPMEATPLLVQLTGLRALEALGDKEGQQMAIEKYKKMAMDLVDLISPRVEGKAKKVSNPNSLARQNRAFSTRIR